MLKLLSHFSHIRLRPSASRFGLLPVLAALFWLAPVPAGAATFTATLDRDTLTLGEAATLSLTFQGAQPQNVPTPPSISNLQIDYLGPSSQFSVIKGQVSSTVTHNFTITPRQPGDYIIPVLTAKVNGTDLSTQPLQLKVFKPSAPSAETINSGSQIAFLKLLLPRKEIYAGETLLAQLQLFLANRVQSISQFQLTAFPANGFNVGKMLEGQHRQTQVGNTIYTIIPINVALKSVQPGTISLGPVTVSLVAELPSTNRRRDPFDPFGMFSRGEQKQLTLASEPETVQVVPLPADNVPPSFNGAVGSYTMTFSAGPTNLTVGDPITLKVQISGRGALDTLTLPEQTAWSDFKTYPPTAKVETTDSLGLQGTKTFEQVITPQNADLKALPGMVFSFFDPEQKTYRTLTQPALPLAIRSSGATPTPTVALNRTGQEAPPPTQDIVPNKQRLGTVAQIGLPLVQQNWFWALQSVPVLALVSVAFWRRRTDSLANNPRLRRQRQVAQVTRDGLQRLRQLAAQNQSDEFFATLFHLLQEQLGERLDLPAFAITEAVIEERLRPRGVAETTLTPLHELFQTCNLARYALIKSSQELAAVIPKVEAVLRQIREVKL